MASVWKTAGVGAAAGLAVPVAGIAGLMAAVFVLIIVQAGLSNMGPAGSLWGRPSWWALMTSEWALYLLISLAIFTLSFRFLARLQARCQALVARINAQQGLSFDSDAYKLHDFSWLLGWQMTWREIESMEMNGGSRQVNRAGISVPTFERTVRTKDFAIELQTTDPQRPLLSFPMSRRAAETWCARLNAIFNG